MLPDRLKSRILSMVEEHEHPRGAALEALLSVVDHLGWISDESLAEVAELLQMTPAELDSRATFYNHLRRKPVGRHVILVCDSVACWIMGSEGMKGYLMEKLRIKEGETTSDGLFTLLPIQCLGVCHEAPAMMIDTELYTRLNPESIDRILAEYRESKSNG